MNDQRHATVGVFGTDREAKSSFEAAVAKRSEAEGIIVYHRTEGGRKISLLDTADFPEKVQGYARIASICDHAYFLFPRTGSLTPPDGELAVLLNSFGVKGTLLFLDGVPTDLSRSAFNGTNVADFPVEARPTTSSVLDTSAIMPRADFPPAGTLVYVDRAFSVKGVGTVALGFVLSGKVSLHDELRPVPGSPGLRAEVRGIQINDVDFDSADRGIRVGLSLRGVEPKDLEKCHWLDDGSFKVADSLELQFNKSAYYKQDVHGRDLHLQVPGETLPARLTLTDGRLEAKLPVEIPAWQGMRVAVLDLNARALRIAGGAACKF